MVVEHGPSDPGGFGDLPDARPVEAACGEGLEAGIFDAGAPRRRSQPAGYVTTPRSRTRIKRGSRGLRVGI